MLWVGVRLMVLGGSAGYEYVGRKKGLDCGTSSDNPQETT